MGLGLASFTGYLPVMNIVRNLLPYADALQSRDLEAVTLLVVHCTELPDLQTAREYGETVHYPESGTGNSGHFYIDRDGRCEQWVPLERIAHHVRGLNGNSIGVELVNLGRWPDWFHAAHQTPTEAYPDVQIAQLLGLIEYLRSLLPNLREIAGHQDLDRQRIPAADDPEQMIWRKIDPGPLFPWKTVLERSSLHRVLR